MSARGRCLAAGLWGLLCCAALLAQVPFLDMPSRRLQRLGEQLALTEAQKRQIIALKRQFEKKHEIELKQLRRDVGRVREALRDAHNRHDHAALKKGQAEAKSLRRAGTRLNEDFERQLLGVLTDSQRQQYAGLHPTPGEAGLLRGDRPPTASKKP